MSSNSPNTIAGPKAANTIKSTSSSLQASASQIQLGSTAVTSDGFGQRRSGGSGSFGAGATSRVLGSPRNSQGSRKQHKGSKRLNRFVDDDVLADTGNMRTTSRKGQTSITHLMNYSLSPSHQFSHRLPHRDHRHGRRQPTWGPGSGYHAADKARYVHANYRFIVDPRADYHIQSIDADIHLDWNTVLQILVSSQSQAASCPICLGTPVAPRMAKCGHIFCLPCLLRYMASEEASSSLPEKKARSRKCPICYDSIYTSETRPVRFYIGQEGELPREGSDIVLRLVTRSASSTLALPRDGADALPRDEDIPWYFAAEVMDFARIMKGTEEYMSQQYDSEAAALEVQEKEDEVMFGQDNVEWMRKAIRTIKDAKEKIKGVGGPTADQQPRIEPKVIRPPIEPSAPSDSDNIHYLQQSSAKFNHPIPHTSGSYTPSDYYFYQALLHYYLSPLDIRILREAFGAFSSFPATILPRVERVSFGHVVDDDLRKRTKYLAHLPYGCEVAFLECDWTDTVPEEVIEKFKPEIERRRKRNEEKEAREEKARITAEKEEEKAYAYLRRKRAEPNLGESERTFALDDFQPLVSNSLTDEAETSGLETMSESPPWTRRQGSGFASLASISTSPSASRTVWGTPALYPPSPNQAPVVIESRDDGWLQDWEKDLLREDEDMVAHVEALSLAGESSKGAGSRGGGAGSNNKKKKKKITLMSTTVRRGA